MQHKNYHRENITTTPPDEGFTFPSKYHISKPPKHENSKEKGSNPQPKTQPKPQNSRNTGIPKDHHFMPQKRRPNNDHHKKPLKKERIPISSKTSTQQQRRLNARINRNKA